MFAYAVIVNLLLTIVSCRRRYRGGGGRAAGIGKVTETFGKGVASFIKDVKEGNWGQQQEIVEYDQRKGNRFRGNDKDDDDFSNSDMFTILVVIGALILVIIILYFVLVILPKWQEKDTRQQMKKRNAQRFKHYEAIKMIAETGVHPDKAFGRLQKIKYK